MVGGNLAVAFYEYEKYSMPVIKPSKQYLYDWLDGPSHFRTVRLWHLEALQTFPFIEKNDITETLQNSGGVLEWYTSWENIFQMVQEISSNSMSAPGELEYNSYGGIHTRVT